MKLTIEHLAPYLPYNLKICYRVLDLENGNPNTDNPDDRMKNCIMIMTGARLDQCLLPETDRWFDKDSVFKPILRALSDLNKYSFRENIISLFESLEKNIKVTQYNSGNNNENDFTLTVTYKLMDDVFTEILVNRGSVSDSRYYFVKWLLDNHFDINGLIDAGLAIDINTIEK